MKAFIKLDVLAEADLCEQAVNKGGNTRHRAPSFSYGKGRGFLFCSFVHFSKTF